MQRLVWTNLEFFAELEDSWAVVAGQDSRVRRFMLDELISSHEASPAHGALKLTHPAHKLQVVVGAFVGQEIRVLSVQQITHVIINSCI